MSFSTRKYPKFTFPLDASSIIIDEEPKQNISMEDYDLKSDKGVKIEHQDDPDPSQEMDIDDYVADNTSIPYVDMIAEPDVQAGAAKEVSATPSFPVTLPGLGNSILQAPKTVPISTIQTEAQKDALQKQQAALYAQMASHRTQDDEEVRSELQETIENPIAQESKYLEARKTYMRKKHEGQVTQEEEMNFMQEEHAYDKRKRELGALIEQTEQESSLFIPDDQARSKSARKKRKRTISETTSDSEDSIVTATSQSSKKAKTRKSKSKSTNKSRTSEASKPFQPSAPTSFGGHNNFWENIDAAHHMNAEPTVEGVAPNTGGRTAVLRGIKARANTTSEAKKAAALDSKRLTKANQSFVTKKGKTFRNKSVKAVSGGWLVSGMKTPLKNYQLINCGWMRDRELSARGPYGGIIADQMGLGKTVTCLANIINGRPLKSFPPHLQPESRTTLIVVPSSLLGQWEAEIKRHTKREVRRVDWGLGRRFIFRDSESEKHETSDFSDNDIVLTTYYDVRRSWPDCKYPEGLSETQRHDFWLENFLNKRGPLHKYHFLRVVLDEGHQIANPETQTANACFNLIADYKWILTGTPMINGAKDLYSLLQFIGHPTVLKMRFESFKSRFCNTKNPMSLDSLSQEMVDSVACFTHKDKLFNARLITLPKPHNKSLTLHPSNLEFEIYNVVRARFKARAQSLTATGNLKSHKFHIWAMHTLLRQMTAHPLIVPTKVCDYLELDDFDRLEKAVERQAASGETAISMIHAFRSVMKTQRTRTEARVANGIQPDMSASPGLIDELDEGADDVDELRQPDVIEENQNERGTGGEHGRNVNLGGYVESLRRSTNFHIFSERSECCRCKRPARGPVMSSCYHFYCHTHMDDMLHEAAAARLNHAVCVKEGCGKAITTNSIINPDAAIKPKWLDADGNVLPSTKTLAVKSQVMNWLDATTGDPLGKIIIFCQWKSFLGMVSRICEVEDWGYTALHGSMSKKTRDANIEKFKTDPTIKILIATLKTGGQGLNLACARYTINVDPYWNTAGEIQAFSRTYRIGQEKETEFVSLTLAGTVDDHMNAIKLRKKLEIDQVNAGHKRMTMEDLLKTFEPTEDGDEESTSN